MTAVAINCGQNLVRSAMPPEMIAGMAAEKVKKEKDLDQRVTIFGGQFLGPYKKAGAMSPAYPTANYATVES
jgi:hypothetical protein